MKNVKVSYPKRRSKIRLEDLGDVSEPERYSMYQVLLDNLKIANRATFIHRIIYVGEHTFFCTDDARTTFEGIINKCNETYCVEKLSGFLLHYNQYFVNMVEGDEDNLNKHLGMLLNKDAPHAAYLGAMKLLIHVSHINQRFFADWIFFTATPPKLLEKLDVSVDLQTSGRYIFNCIKKIYSLIGNYADDRSSRTGKSFDTSNPYFQSTTNSIGELESGTQVASVNKLYSSLIYNMSMSQSTDYTNVDMFYKEYKLFLPEYELLDFTLKTDFTMKLQEYYSLYGVVPMRDIYKDRVWPVPHDFIPYDVFEKPYDCLTELPKENRRKTKSHYPASAGTSSMVVVVNKETDTGDIEEEEKKRKEKDHDTETKNNNAQDKEVADEKNHKNEEET